MMTVKQLKEIIKDWPEVNLDNGEETEVWVETGWCRSSPITCAVPLNLRENETGSWSDIIFETATSDEDGKPKGVKNEILCQKAIAVIEDGEIFWTTN